MRAVGAGQSQRAMTVAGVMSGTSADGVDVAVVRITPKLAGGLPKIEVIGHRGYRYSKVVREAVLGAMGTAATSTAELSRLNWRLGEVYADCVMKACAELEVSTGGGNPGRRRARALDLVGLHGQTVYHQADAARFAGALVRATWQMGEAAVVRERVGVPVVSDFRPADLAAGGQGAPLVPMLDFCLFQSARKNRLLLNLGGIANVTLMPAGGVVTDVVAFDIGPANIVIDALMRTEFGKQFDKGGQVAKSGRVIAGAVEKFLRERWFQKLPPKSCGREQFGAAFVGRLRALCPGAVAKDLVATATELTVASVVQTIDRFCVPHCVSGRTELIAAGGGVRNDWMMTRLSDELTMRGIKVAIAPDAQAKEAVAFALLAWLSWHGLPGNIASATGADGGRVLGKLTC